MLFKTKYLKDKLFGNLLMQGIFLLVLLFILVFTFITKEIELLYLCIPFVILMILIQLEFFQQIQWYEVYDDKIVIKNIYGKVSEVKFEDVKKIYEINLPIFTSIELKSYYVFLDGRPLKSFLHPLNIDNHKKFCVRVWITDELKKLIENKEIEIQKKELCDIYYG